MNNKIDLIFILIIGIIFTHFYYNTREDFYNTPSTPAPTVAPLDDSSTRNLASICSKIVENNTLLIHSNINFTGPIQSNNAELIPIGSVLPFAGPAANIPTGWLLCDGRVINAGEYPILAGVIGSIYGAANKLPNLNNNTIVGTGKGDDLTNRKIGAYGGAETHTLSVNEMPYHNHTLQNYSHKHNYSYSWSGTRCTGSCKSKLLKNRSSKQTSEAGAHGHTMNNTGGNVAHDNMMPYYVLNYIIRAK